MKHSSVYDASARLCLFPDHLVGAPSVIITTAQYEGVLPLRLRACWIFIVLIPSQVPVHYSSSNNPECIIYIITVRLARAVCWEAVLLHILHTPTCTNMLSLQRAKGKRMRERERELTVSWNDPQRHRVSSLFDQVDDIRVGLIGDGAAVYSQDPVSDF